MKPGSYGECSRVLQRVDGAYINSFGVKKWTEIVNDQLKLKRSSVLSSFGVFLLTLLKLYFCQPYFYI